MTPTPSRWLTILHAVLVTSGCALLLFVVRLAAGPVLALLRQVSIEPVGPAVYWLTTGAVMIGAPIAGWWTDAAGRPVSLVVGTGFVAASLALLTSLHAQAWVVLYSLLTFGAVLTGIAATTMVATLARRMALATVIAVGLPFIRVAPSVPPGMRALLGMGERAFVVLGIGLVVISLLPLLAIGLAELIERRLGGAPGPETTVDRGTGPIGYGLAMSTLALAGWASQVGAAGADLARALPSEGSTVAWSFAVVVGGSLAAYLWAIATDVTTHASWTRPRPLRACALLGATLAIFAAGALLMVVAPGRTSLLVGLLASGVGLAGTVPLATAGALRDAEVGRWGATLGLAVAAFAFGQTAGARVNVYLAAWMGTLGPIVLAGAAAAVLAWRLFRLNAASAPRSPEPAVAAASGHDDRAPERDLTGR